MHHIRTLNLHTNRGFAIGAHAIWKKPAPLLERLSFHNSGSDAASVGIRLNASDYPRLSCFQSNSANLTGTILSDLHAVQSLRTFSIGNLDNLNFLLVAISVSVTNITTINIELASWSANPSSFTFSPALCRINIRWTKPGIFIPVHALPGTEAWNSVQAVHISHVGDSSGDPLQASLAGANFPILARVLPYQSLWVRTSDQGVHVRVGHEDGRDRVFCGLHPTTVSGVAARIPGLEPTTLTVATTAVALNVISNAPWPGLRRIRIVLDTDDITWISIFARDMFNVPTLEQLELSIQADAMASWTTSLILRVLASCMTAGHNLQKVGFLGFAPESSCVARADAFADEVVMDRNWREPEEERVWFTEPAFEW